MLDKDVHKLTREESELLFELVNDHIVFGLMNESFFDFCSAKARSPKRWDKSVFSSKFCNAIESLVQEPLAWLEVELNSHFLNKIMYKQKYKSGVMSESKNDWNDITKKEKLLAERLFTYKLTLSILLTIEEKEIYGDAHKITSSIDRSKRVSATNPSSSIEKVSIENEIALILKNIINLMKEDTSKIDAIEYLKCIRCSMNMTTRVVEWKSNIQYRRAKKSEEKDYTEILDEEVKENEMVLSEGQDDKLELPVIDKDYSLQIRKEDRNINKIQMKMKMKINKNEFQREKQIEKSERTQNKAPKKLGKKAKRRQAYEKGLKISKNIDKNSHLKSQSKQCDEASDAQISFLTKNEEGNEDNPALSATKNHQGEADEENLVSSLATETSKVERGTEESPIESDQKSPDTGKNNIKGVETYNKICPKFLINELFIFNKLQNYKLH